MMRFAVVLAASALLFASVAQAEDTFHPSRARLLFHGAQNIDNVAQLRAHFIPSGNLMNGLSPLVFLGAGMKPADWIDIEPALGWTFGNNEPILSLRLCPAFGKFYVWADAEINLPSKNGYWFAQADYKILDWLHAGIESEGFGGNYEDGSSWSHGGGPNVLLRLGKMGVDTALHIRDLDHSVRPEFLMRFHVFL